MAREEVSQQQTQATEALVAIENTQQNAEQNRTYTETLITESMDTVVEVFPMVDGKPSEIPVSVTDRQKKVTQKREFADQKQQHTIQTRVLAEQEDHQTSKAKSSLTEKHVQRPTLLLPIL